MGGRIDIIGTPPPRGFSLIELLVVIAMLSVLAIGMTFSIGRRGESGDPERFQAAFQLQQGLAIEGRQMRGLQLNAKGMTVMLWRRDAEGVPGWQASGAKVGWRGAMGFSSPRLMPLGVPEIVFLPGGKNSAFSIQFDGNRRCESSGWADLTCG